MVASLVLCTAALLGAGAGDAGAQLVRSGVARISLRPSPVSLPADGKARSRVRIEVRGRDNEPAKDDTPVLCHAVGCLLSTDGTDWQQSLTVPTQGGYAVIYATSEEPGSAVITARVQESSNTVILEFLGEGEAAQTKGARVLDIRGGWVGYCLDSNVIVAREGARAQFGPLIFDAADGLELDVEAQTLRCWGVKVSRKGETLEGEDCYFDLTSRRGMVRYFGEEGVERAVFTIHNLRPPQASDLSQDAFQGRDWDGSTWLVCRQASYFLGEKIVLRRAVLYSEGQKVFSFPPYWVIGLAGYSGASNTQVLGVSTDGGLAVDFPFFYRVTTEWAGSVRIQKGARGTSFMARDGWSLGLSEEYRSGDVKGTIEVGGLFTNDWGIEWRDERPVFGDSQGYFSLSWPDHRNLFADANLYRYNDSYRLNLTASYDNPSQGATTYGLVADWLTEPRRATGASSYRLGFSLGARHGVVADRDWVVENELYASLDFDTRRIGRHARLNFGISDYYLWDTRSFQTNNLRGQLRLSREFGSEAYLGLDYYVAYRSGDASRQGFNQMLGFALHLSPGTKWTAYANGTWDVTSGDTYGYASISRRLGRDWRAVVSGIHHDFEATRYNDLEFGLARTIGDREIGLLYSVDTGRLSLELGGLGVW